MHKHRGPGRICLRRSWSLRAGGLALILAAGLLAGCSGNNPRSSARTKAGTASSASRAVDDPLDAVHDLLRKSNDLDACRAAIQQLNQHLQRPGVERPRALSQEERALLSSQFGLDEAELTEVSSPTFTSLDVRHLELSLLLHDAIRALHIDRATPLQQATAGLDWIVRQVHLREGSGTALPPYLVLRIGFGTALERAMIFVELLDQLGIDSCMIGLAANQSGQPSLQYWIPGALIDKQIYLFDTRLGLPLPGPNGRGVATLAQVRQDPTILRALTVDAKNAPYDVTPEQVKQAEVHVACSLSALAPRMRYLQDFLAPTEKVPLGVDPIGEWQRFQEACQAPPLKGIPLRVWNVPGDPNTPIRVLRLFLPVEEGGIDQTHRREQIIRQLIPWNALPAQVRELPGEPGQRLQQIFSTPFVMWATEPRMKKELWSMWVPGIAETGPANMPSERKTSEFAMRERLPRDLVLHGRYDEATGLLVAIHDELHRQIRLRDDPDVEKRVEQWKTMALAIYSALIKAQQGARGGAGNDASTLSVAEAQQSVTKLWEASRDVHVLVQGAAAVPMLTQVEYLLALCKQEQAEQIQGRNDRLREAGKSVPPDGVKAAEDAWASALGWWETFLHDQGASPAAPVARRLKARAQLALGQRDAAIATIEDLSGPVHPLDKTARLYLAKQWRSP